MSRDILERIMKEAYMDARGSAKVEHGSGNDKEYSYRMLAALRDMASADVYPDNRFSDEEVTIWEMFWNMKIKS